MTKLDAGLITSLLASDPGSAAVWDSKRINPRPQFCLCLAWSGCPSNDDDIKHNTDELVAVHNLKNLKLALKGKMYNKTTKVEKQNVIFKLDCVNESFKRGYLFMSHYVYYLFV